jgi:hypothetical protein
MFDDQLVVRTDADQTGAMPFYDPDGASLRTASSGARIVVTSPYHSSDHGSRYSMTP